MTQLLSISTTPAKLHYQHDAGQYRYTHQETQLHISRQEGGLRMSRTPSKLNIDTFEASNSLRPTTIRSIEQAADKGRSAANDATAKYASQGQRLLDAKIGQELITTFSKEETFDQSAQFVMDFLPSTGAEITYQPGDLNIDYQSDRLTFDWRVSEANLDFSKADVDFSLSQEPHVDIQYVAGPNIVP